jgi:hypothetical protein
MPANLPYEEDFFQRIVNVNWGQVPDVIVVFMEVSSYIPQLVFNLTLSGDKATFLSSWNTPTYKDDPAPLKNSAYKIKSNDGIFVESTSPALPPEGQDRVGAFLAVLVFAVDSNDVPGSLKRAVAATKLIAPLYIVDELNADLPSDTSPPGMLWGVETGNMAPGVVMQWKIRYGNHRDPDKSPPPPPNNMAQCYPIISSHPGYVGDIEVTYSGYFLIAYRLDKSGTGPVYSKIRNPPEWNVLIVSGPYPGYGTPFVDPPPLISVDLTD